MEKVSKLLSLNWIDFLRFILKKEERLGEDFIIKVLKSEKELELAYKLRYQVFVKELKWLPENPSQLEKDEYDQFSIPIGIFKGKELIGFVRLIPDNPLGFMLEKAFKETVDPKNKLQKRKSIEISRLCLKKEYRDKKIKNLPLIIHLFAFLYKLCRLYRIRYWYFSLEEGYLTKLKLSYQIPIKILGKAYEYQPGVKTISGMVDIRELKSLG